MVQNFRLILTVAKQMNVTVEEAIEDLERVFETVYRVGEGIFDDGTCASQSEIVYEVYRQAEIDSEKEGSQFYINF